MKKKAEVELAQPAETLDDDVEAKQETNVQTDINTQDQQGSVVSENELRAEEEVSAIEGDSDHEKDKSAEAPPELPAVQPQPISLRSVVLKGTDSQKIGHHTLHFSPTLVINFADGKAEVSEEVAQLLDEAGRIE